MTGIQDKNYYDNVEQDFVPNGATVTEVWDEIAELGVQHLPQPAVRARRLAAGRQALRPLPLAADRRSRYPSNRGLQGHGPQDPHGRKPPERPGRHPLHSRGNTDFSEVVFPQDIRNCTTCHAPPATQNTTSGTRTRRGPPAAPATTTSTGRPARTTRPERRPTSSAAPAATSRSATASGTRRSRARTRCRTNRPSSRA